MAVNNLVFDIGNVLLKWAPKDIIRTTFTDHIDQVTLVEDIFKSPIWYDLNKGKYTEQQAISLYHKSTGIEQTLLMQLMHNVKTSLIPIEGSFELLDQLYKKNIPLYCITDNINEIMVYLKTKYDFLTKFKDVVVSADIGSLKSDERIFLHFLAKNKLKAENCIFIDDHEPNIEVAKNIGFKTILFTTSKDCTKQLATILKLVST